ncbi:MAG: hypothetical protein HPY45_00110 [Anaerolineae bacterium]|nr:hypothetical protein [Anaerolineae bacterium]
MNQSNKPVIVVLLILLLLCCCIVLCVAAVLGATGIGGYTLFQQLNQNWLATPLPFEFNIPTLEPWSSPEPTPTFPSEETPLSKELPDQGAFETLRTLQQSVVPSNDLRELAMRLEGKGEVPIYLDTQPTPLKIGDRLTFWKSNVDTHEHVKTEAVVRYVGENIYFFVEDGVNYKESDLKDLASTFDQKIYPTNRKFFGNEFSPGIDNDPHLYILYATDLGNNIAGYFSSVDSIHPLAHEYSNAHEMFYISADNVGLDEEFTYGTLAHEFQHMIHWYHDKNETSWLNEGFSVLAELLNQYDVGGFDWLYTSNPDLQLNDWPNDPNATSPHYGAGFLFVTYFLDRFGEQATQALVKDEENGWESVDSVLSSLVNTDPSSGKPISSEDVFRDWVIANYLMDDRIGDGRYYYNNYRQAPQASETETVYNCPTMWQNREVKQFGVDYIRIDCPGKWTLSFEGTSEVGVLPMDAYSGNFAFWSNKGDESDMMLTQEFDFSNVSAPIELQFRTWYDLEEDYDYLYLEASEDGKTWTILKTPSCTEEDPSGNSYGCGWNGVTDGWIQENVDISQYAGKKVLLRFEYITDAAVNGEGFLLDDVAIPAIGYSTDFEKDTGGWKADGFVRIENRLPQTYIVSLIKLGDKTTVEPVQLDEYNTFNLAIDEDTEVVLVVSGSTRFTRQPAAYRFKLE